MLGPLRHAGVQAELSATAPALLLEALEELLLGTLDGFTQVGSCMEAGL